MHLPPEANLHGTLSGFTMGPDFKLSTFSFFFFNQSDKKISLAGLY